MSSSFPDHDRLRASTSETMHIAEQATVQNLLGELFRKTSPDQLDATTPLSGTKPSETVMVALYPTPAPTSSNSHISVFF